MPDITEVIPEKQDGEFVRFPIRRLNCFSPLPPAGDQPRPLPSWWRGCGTARCLPDPAGRDGSGKTFTMANVIARMGRPAIVLRPTRRWRRSCTASFASSSPRTRWSISSATTTTTSPKAYVPQRDLFIEKDSAINEHIEQMRLSCTKSLMERRDVVIVATVSAIYGIGEPESYHRMVMTLRVGDKLGQRDVIAS